MYVQGFLFWCIPKIMGIYNYYNRLTSFKSRDSLYESIDAFFSPNYEYISEPTPPAYLRTHYKSQTHIHRFQVLDFDLFTFKSITLPRPISKNNFGLVG